MGLFKINTCCIIVLTTKANMRNELDQCANMLSTRCNDIYYINYGGATNVDLFTMFVTVCTKVQYASLQDI